MINKPDWDITKKRLEAFWNREYIERCNMALYVRNPNTDFKQKYNKEEQTHEFRFLNDDYVYDRCLTQTKNTIYKGEAFPVHYTNFGTSAHCTYFGCNANYMPGTVWFDPCLDDSEASELNFDINNCEAFEMQKRFMKTLCASAKNDFMVGMNDNCGILDALAEVRGTDNLLMDLIAEPEFVKEALGKITDAWKQTQNQFFDIIKDNNQGGSSHGWMNTWHKGRHAQIQCDFSVMISPEHFEEFALPEIEETSAFLDGCSYHLDGQEQIRHLDMILSVKSIHNIQWTPVAGQPLTSEFIPVLQKIQNAGKGLLLFPKPHEIPILLKELSHKGLQIVSHAVQTEQDADDLLELAVKLAH